MYSAIVVTVSDRCYNKIYEDKSGPIVAELLSSYGFAVKDLIVVPDEKNMICNALNTAVKNDISLIVTTGGTGFSKRDITPECTKEVIDREAPGLAEAMRYYSAKITDRAFLSRAVCGIKNNSLIINLPGSQMAAKENLQSIIDNIKHGLDMLLSKSADCGNNLL